VKILAIEKETHPATSNDYAPHLKDEAAQVWALYQAGVIREIYFRQDRPEAVLVLECADDEEARQALSTLPLVQERLITFDLIPLRPYPGLARLWEEAS